jgi:hypothetical protein
MPLMVTIVPNPAYPKKESAEFKAAAPVKLAYIQAMENIQRSGGLYVLEAVEPKTTVPGPRALEDMGNDELKVMLVSLGVKTQKQMKRDDMIGLIRRKLDEIEVDDASE